jgi:hypothetical protein
MAVQSDDPGYGIDTHRTVPLQRAEDQIAVRRL